LSRPPTSCAKAIATATVIPGHRVASGQGGDARFPNGTIALQLPAFRAWIPDLVAWLGGEPFPGTLNLRMPGRVAIGRPEILTPALRWTELLPAERFFLSRARLQVAGTDHPVWLYMPDPATKPDHFQAADTLELIGRFIPDAAYGRLVQLDYDPAAITLN
jgi:CTP-dependent riboflavin kinase